MEMFASEARSLILSQSGCHLPFVEDFKKTFDYFHRYTVECGIPLGSILVSKREVCPRCGRKLVIEAGKTSCMLLPLSW